jgi:hypothetical protein
MRRCRGEAGGLLPGLRERLATALRPDDGADAERGSAVVEFLSLGSLLLVPVVYFIVGIGQVQAGSFAVVSAADHGAKVFAAAATPAEGRDRTEQAVLVSARDFGFDGGRLRRPSPHGRRR